MSPPEPAGRRWSRRLQTLGALVLMLAPALPWARFPLGAHVIWLPGLIFHGMVVMGVGIVAFVASLLRRPWSGLKAFLGLLALVILVWDAHMISARTEYQMQRFQLWMADSTSFLSSIWTPPRIVPTGWKPLAFIDQGLWIAMAGGSLLVLGGLGEAMSYGRTRPWVGVLLGRPTCGQCRHRIGLDTGFCPHCGVRLVVGTQCARCAAWGQAEDLFCGACGSDRSAQLENGREQVLRDRQDDKL